MTVNDYQRQAMRTLNPALGKKDVLINSVMGLCGEAGEAIDIVKKWLAQGHELDRAHLVRDGGQRPGRQQEQQAQPDQAPGTPSGRTMV